MFGCAVPGLVWSEGRGLVVLAWVCLKRKDERSGVWRLGVDAERAFNFQSPRKNKPRVLSEPGFAREF